MSEFNPRKLDNAITTLQDALHDGVLYNPEDHLAMANSRIKTLEGAIRMALNFLQSAYESEQSEHSNEVDE